MPPRTDLLASVDDLNAVFSGVDAQEAQAVLAAFKPARYGPGETLFTQGEPGSFLLIVEEGRVKLSILSEEGRELTVRHATRGHVLGEIAALDGGSRTASAVAVGPVLARRLDRTQLRQLMARFPSFAERMVVWLCNRLRATTAQLEAIALHALEVRIARFLLFALQGRRAEGGRRVPLDLGFSQGELALFVGGSRSKVNGVLSALEKAGAIKRTQDRIFCDPDHLARIAQVEDATRLGDADRENA